MSQTRTLLDALADGRTRRTGEIRSMGIQPMVAERLCARGLLERLEGPSGILIGYRAPVAENDPDMRFSHLAEIAVRHSGALFCLTSALRFHDLTDDIEGPEMIALPPGRNRNVPPERVGSLRILHWSSAHMRETGIQLIHPAGIPVRITDPVRTVVDLFRPEHGRPDGEAPQALARLALREGEGVLSKAFSYAVRLGWYDEIADPISATREMLKWHAPRIP